MSDDDDSVTILDVDGAVILQVYRLLGRAKIYVQSPTIGATSIPDDQARKLAALILDTLGEAR